MLLCFLPSQNRRRGVKQKDVMGKQVSFKALSLLIEMRACDTLGRELRYFPGSFFHFLTHIYLLREGKSHTEKGRGRKGKSREVAFIRRGKILSGGKSDLISLPMQQSLLQLI